MDALVLGVSHKHLGPPLTAGSGPDTRCTGYAATPYVRAPPDSAPPRCPLPRERAHIRPQGLQQAVAHEQRIMAGTLAPYSKSVNALQDAGRSSAGEIVAPLKSFRFRS